MKKWFLFVLLTAGLLFGRDYYQKDRIMFCLQKDLPYLNITYENGIAHTGQPGLDALLQKYQVTKLEKGYRSADAKDVVGETDLSRVYSAEFKAPKQWDALHEMINDFTALPQIISGDLSSINYLTATPQNDPYEPNDTRYGEQWFMNTIKANYAWGLWGSATPGDPTVLIGDVDNGVDTEHPDLDGVLYLNPGEDLNNNGVVDASDKNGIDDDHNGYVDDFYGWDFADNDNDIRPPSSGVDNALSHGTHTTGIAAAATDNSTGVSGVSFRSQVIATKHSRDADSTTSEPGIYYGYDGILYVAKLGAKFINCSWGGSYMSSYDRNILDEVSASPYYAIVVGAAGNDEHSNDDYPQYPSDYSKCICVAATTIGDKKAYYSNWGSVVDISAPGGEGAVSSSAILSTIHWNAGGYAAWQGTSMAAPVVTGAFALLKAWFPNQDRQWYWDELLANTDNIDDQNPDYLGELGSGRLNIYNAIARNAFPYLTIADYSYEVINDNGDGQVNPGESANLVLKIKNDPDYLDANSTTVTLSSSNPYITFSDNTADLGTINAGDSATTATGDLVFHFTDNAPLEPLYIRVTLQANPTADHPYSYTDSVLVQATLNQVGFPVTRSDIAYPVAAADLLGDGKLEIVAYGQNDSLYVIESDGTIAPGFPVYIGYTTMGPAIADVDNDGQKEIVIAQRSDGIIKIIENDGTLDLNKQIDEQIRGDISLGNLDSDADLEIVFGTMDKKVHVMNIDGTELPNFPVTYNSQIDQGIAIGDVAGDATPELVFGLLNSDLYVINAGGATLSGFPVDLSSRVTATPVIADIKDDAPYLVVATNDRKIQRLDLSGNVNWTYGIDGYVKSAITLTDFNKDGGLDIAFGTDHGKLYVMTFGGDTIAPFPLTLDNDVRVAPVFADLDNNGTLEMISSTDGGFIYAHEADGSLYKNFPAYFEGAQQGSPCIADIDMDGDAEIILGGDNGLNVIDIKDTKGSSSGLWQTYQANNARTSYYYYDPSASAISSTRPVPEKFALYANYPNPFNPQTTLRYSLKKESDVQLSIYNLLGQKVRTLLRARQKAGVYRINWNGADNQGRNVSSGIYLYQLTLRSSGKEMTFSRKMLLVR